MAQYDVHPAPGGGYLLELQSDFLDAIASTVVAPLVPVDMALVTAKRLNPVFDILGSRYLLVTQSLAAVPRTILGAPVASLADHRDDVTAALDMVFHGF